MISQLPKITLAILCAFIAYQAALLTWGLYPVKKQSYTWTPATNTTKNDDNSEQLTTKLLQEQHLFGQFVGERKVQGKTTDAPRTKLKLTLVGIIAATEPAYSSVIIEYKNSQDSYFIDSDIPGTGARVSEIYQDRIIIVVDGEAQTLVLDGLEKDIERMDRVERGQTVLSRPDKSKKIELDRNSLIDNPAKLLDYIKISPVREGNVVKGYRVNPGKDPELFEEAGLIAGDLAIELNGVDLTNTAEAVGLMKEFPTMTDISLTVDRDGEINELFFSIP
ncbi:type II secretion system protein GspC [Psychromonas aquatilis]|uniref:Type II secretion system protein GspC n=1 Tax=Psychromonas aquatilis TaxID=2005072 RepID=A0ABU9GP97_9GAMM